MKQANRILDSIDELLERESYGEVDPLRCYVALKEVEKYLQGVLKGSLYEKAMDAYESHGEREVYVGDYRVTSEARGVRWDYSGCCDPVRDQMKSALVSREKWLQGLEAPVVLETGETICPAEQKFTVSLVVSSVKRGVRDGESVD